MQVKVGSKLLIPSVQHQCEANLTAQFTPPKLQKGRRGRIKQEFEQPTLVAFTGQNPRIQFVWQRKDLMEVGNGQEFELPCISPGFSGPRLTLGTVSISATVINKLLKIARSTSLKMPTQSGSSTIDNRTHHFQVALRDAVSL